MKIRPIRKHCMNNVLKTCLNGKAKVISCLQGKLRSTWNAKHVINKQEFLIYETGANIKNLFGPRTVSYTHLDVYKRQM